MIHKTAIVDSKANISSNVKIGPYSIFTLEEICKNWTLFNYWSKC